MSWEEAIEETRAVSEENARRREAEERFEALNPFLEGAIYPVMVEVTDRKKLWDFMGANLYTERNDIPGGKIVAIQTNNPESNLDEILNSMETFLRKNGRL